MKPVTVPVHAYSSVWEPEMDVIIQPPAETEITKEEKDKYQEEFDQFQQELDKRKDEFQKDHPELTEHPGMYLSHALQLHQHTADPESHLLPFIIQSHTVVFSSAF